jgi:hypothetical protein
MGYENFIRRNPIFVDRFDFNDFALLIIPLDFTETDKPLAFLLLDSDYFQDLPNIVFFLIIGVIDQNILTDPINFL